MSGHQQNLRSANITLVTKHSESADSHQAFKANAVLIHSVHPKFWSPYLDSVSVWLPKFNGDLIDQRYYYYQIVINIQLVYPDMPCFAMVKNTSKLPTLPVTLASFLMNTSPILTRYQLCLNHATRTSVSFAASDHISITKLPVPLPPPSCTPSLTTATHSTTTYQILN